MITAWILYGLLVGTLVAAGALVLEHLLRAHRLPTRWVWVGSMGLTLLWPLVHLLWKSWPREAGSVGLPDPGRIAVLDPLAVQVTQESFLRVLDGPILAVWIASSGLMVAFFLILVIRTRRVRLGWTGAEAGGHPVLYSDDLGPAVVGYVRPEIVLPAWCRELEGQTLRLILDHEMEHLRAGDLRLMLTVGALPVLFPWHLPLWWQFKRLRAAVESDCDLRVVRKYPDRIRPYMELLLQVGRREPRNAALVAMLSEPEQTLAQRIRIMTMPFPKKPWLRGGFLAAVGGVLVAVACWAPSPSEAPEDAADAANAADVFAVELPPEVEVPPELEIPPVVVKGTRQRVPIPPSPEKVLEGDRSPSQPAAFVTAAPTFTPFTVRPDIKNREAVARALEQEYPPLLKDAGIGGTIQVWFHIDSSGKVEKLVVEESSGHKALDDAALRVARAIEFTPALNRDEPVPVWISLPITFSAGAGDAADARKPETPWEALKHLVAVTIESLKGWIHDLWERGFGGDKAGGDPAPAADASSEEAPLSPEADLSSAPTFTPFTVRPDIKNRTDVARALEREYPPLLRDAGIGGTIDVWFFIDKTGEVRRVQVDNSSGHKALDEAALRVAEAIEFTPALNRDGPVPVWISLPITFTTR